MMKLMKSKNVFVVTDKSRAMTTKLNIKDGEFGWQNASQKIGIALGSELKYGYPHIDAEAFVANMVYWLRVAGQDPVMFDPTLIGNEEESP